MKPYHLIIFWTAVIMLIVGCASEPQTVEVTRIVNQDIPVTVEVIREVAVAVTVPVEIPVEVPVEVTRLVEVVVTPTAESTGPETTEVEPSPTAVAEQGNGSTAVSSIYTVQAGDNMSLITAKTGVLVGDIMAANNLTNASIIIVGQQLTIPGWDGQIVADVAPAAPVTAAATPVPDAPPVAAVPVGTNLLPNASFEGDWYFFNGVQEWQISEGWSLAIDEGPNPLTEEDDVYIRPEVRVVSKANLPPTEHDLFVFDGQKTIKIFKGGAPVHFAVFTELQLPAGSYRFTVNFFADTVSIYDQGRKVWATHPQAAEVRFILNSGGSDWLYVAPGQKNTQTFDFTLEEAATVRLGADFRNRYVNHNNGWFLDDWSLQQLATP